MYTITIKSIGYLIRRTYHFQSDFDYNVTLVLDLLDSLGIKYKKVSSCSNIHIEIISILVSLEG